MPRPLTRRTALAHRARRLGLNLADVARLTGAPYNSVRNWHAGRTPCPRPVLRLLAAWRLLHWRQPPPHP